MGSVGWASILWVALAGFYLFLAGEVSAVEGVAALVSASFGTALAVALARVTHRHQSVRPAPRALLRPLAALLPETFGVGRQLVGAILMPKDRRGAFVRQPFDPGADDDPKAAGRRAVAVLGISLAPGSFVVRGERSDTLIVHALPPAPASPDRRWPA